MINDPGAIRDLYAAEQEGTMVLRPQMEPWLRYREWNGLPVGIQNSNDYKSWYRLRKAVNEIIFKPKDALKFSAGVEPVAEHFTNLLREKVSASKDGQVDLFEDLQSYSLEAIGTVLFGQRLGCFDPIPSEDTKRFALAVQGFFVTSNKLAYGKKRLGV